MASDIGQKMGLGELLGSSPRGSHPQNHGKIFNFNSNSNSKGVTPDLDTNIFSHKLNNLEKGGRPLDARDAQKASPRSPQQQTKNSRSPSPANSRNRKDNKIHNQTNSRSMSPQATGTQSDGPSRKDYEAVSIVDARNLMFTPYGNHAAAADPRDRYRSEL